MSPLRSWAGGLLAVLWIPLMLGTAMVYFRSEHGVQGILMILLMAVSNDTFGYIAGVNWGKHPMAPRISPKKSWEGLDVYKRQAQSGAAQPVQGEADPTVAMPAQAPAQDAPQQPAQPQYGQQQPAQPTQFGDTDGDVLQ